MKQITPDNHAALQVLGAHLKAWRQAQRGLGAADAAARLGVSRTTYWRMERGTPGIEVDHWISALREMGVLDEVLRAAEPSLFHVQADQFPDYG